MGLSTKTGGLKLAQTEVITDIYEEAPATEDRVVRYRSLNWTVLKGVFAPYPTFNGLAPVTPKNIKMFQGKRVLDLGCGSGVRAVIARMSGAEEVLATDISYDACRNTRINADRHNQKVSVVCASMFEGLNTRFDTIVSYLPSRDAPVEKPEDRAIHDPGFELNFQLIDEAADFLVGRGSLHTAFLDQGQVGECSRRIEANGYVVDSYKILPHETGDWHFASIIKP